jgi:hypothetical protein
MRWLMGAVMIQRAKDYVEYNKILHPPNFRYRKSWFILLEKKIKNQSFWNLVNLSI